MVAGYRHRDCSHAGSGPLEKQAHID